MLPAVGPLGGKSERFMKCGREKVHQVTTVIIEAQSYLNQKGKNAIAY